MTDYELIELSGSRSDEYSRTFRFWISLNFAVVVAAYAAGDLLNIWTTALVLGLYALITYTNALVSVQILAVQKGFVEEMKELAQVSEASHPALRATIGSLEVSRTSLPAGVALRSALVIGTIVFVLHRAGYLG
jgi:hypothetical protein